MALSSGIERDRAASIPLDVDDPPTPTKITHLPEKPLAISLKRFGRFFLTSHST
jgi:hypothetical protein